MLYKTKALPIERSTRNKTIFCYHWSARRPMAYLSHSWSNLLTPPIIWLQVATTSGQVTVIFVPSFCVLETEKMYVVCHIHAFIRLFIDLFNDTTLVTRYHIAFFETRNARCLTNTVTLIDGHAYLGSGTNAKKEQSLRYLARLAHAVGGI